MSGKYKVLEGFAWLMIAARDEDEALAIAGRFYGVDEDNIDIVFVNGYYFARVREEAKGRTGLNGTFVLDRECPDIYVTPKKDGFVSVLDKVRLSIEKILIRVKPEDRKYELQSYIHEALTEDDIRAWHEGTLTPTTEVITDILNAHGYELKVWGSKAPNAPEPFSVTVS